MGLRQAGFIRAGFRRGGSTASGGANVKYWVGAADPSVPNALDLSGITGIVKSSAGTPAAAVAGTDYIAPSTSKSFASGASATWNGADITGTATVSGNTHITTATGVNSWVFEQPTISAAAALTVDYAATVVIVDAPTGGGAGPATITNAYALWIQHGALRADGGIILPTFTQGSVLFASSTGQISQDNAHFLFDDTLYALGVNVNSGVSGGSLSNFTDHPAIILQSNQITGDARPHFVFNRLFTGNADGRTVLGEQALGGIQFSMNSPSALILAEIAVARVSDGGQAVAIEFCVGGTYPINNIFQIGSTYGPDFIHLPLGSGAMLAANATTGFFGMAAMNGSPTAAPSIATVFNCSPIVIDRPDKVIFYYPGGGGTGNAWQPAGGLLPEFSTSSSYPAGDPDYAINADATGGAVTVTLPTAVGRTGKLYAVKRMNSAGSNVTVASSGGNIEGASTLTLGAQYDTRIFQSDGTNWWIIGGNFVSNTDFVPSSTSATITSAAGATWNGATVSGTATVTGNTHITTATGLNSFVFNQPTISAASALTVDNAATVVIANAPAAAGAGPATITNAYALWIQAGSSRFDGNLLLNTTDVASTILRVDASKTIASATGATWDGVDMIAATATISGATAITTSAGFNAYTFRAPTLSAASALTVTNAATVTILGPPAAAGAGPATITNAYALWTQAGQVLFDSSAATGLYGVSVLGGIASNGAQIPFRVGNVNSLSAGNAYIAEFFTDNMTNGRFAIRGDGVIKVFARIDVGGNIITSSGTLGSSGLGNADGKGTIYAAAIRADQQTANVILSVIGNVNDGAGAIAVKIQSAIALTSGRDRSVVAFYNNGTGTKLAEIYPDGGANFTGKLNFASGVYAANGSVATTVTSLGPAGSHTTIQKWLTIYDSDGTTTLYIPCY